MEVRRDYETKLPIKRSVIGDTHTFDAIEIQRQQAILEKNQIKNQKTKNRKQETKQSSSSYGQFKNLLRFQCTKKNRVDFAGENDNVQASSDNGKNVED